MGAPARGVTDLAKYRKGKRLTPQKAMLAKCADCMNGYMDGKVDCEIPTCSLYPYMPYRD